MPAITHGTVTLEKYVDKFTAELDGIVMQDTCTADLNMNQDLLGKLSNTGSIEVAKISMSGLATHRRGAGYVPGNVNLEWETLQLEYERDREFSVDARDDEETAAVLSANLMNEFARTQVVPEIDAVRFGRLYSFAGENAKVGANVTTAKDALASVMSAEAYFEEMGVDLASCILYVSAHFKGLLRSSQNWQAYFGQNPNTGITEFDRMKLVTPSNAVFQTAFTLLDGIDHSGESEGKDQTSGGFEPTSGAKGINFMIVRPDAVGAIAKHQDLRYFSPRVNQKSNSHLWQYDLYHDLLGYDNKKDLIYAHTKA